MSAPARCLGSSTGMKSQIDSSPRLPGRRARAASLMVRSVASGNSAPVAGKRLSIAIGAAVSGAAGLAVATLASQGVDVVQTVQHMPQDIWGIYQDSLVTHPLQTKACISGFVYTFGDLIAQTYEGEGSNLDVVRAGRSGLCGFFAHGPLSHFWYLACDNFFAGLPVANAWYLPLLKIGVDQTVWTVTWNATYYALLGVLRGESPAAIAESVRSSWLDLMRAGWRLWPAAHLVTYGLLPQQHRLLWVDTVELVWVTILSTYGQQQRDNLAAAEAAALVSEAEPVEEPASLK